MKMRKRERMMNLSIMLNIVPSLLWFLSATGGMGPIATTSYKRLAYLLSDRSNQSYNQKIRWLRCNLSFSLLRSLIMCLRGACSSSGKPQLSAGDISLAISKARL